MKEQREYDPRIGMLRTTSKGNLWSYPLSQEEVEVLKKAEVGGSIFITQNKNKQGHFFVNYVPKTRTDEWQATKDAAIAKKQQGSF